MNELKQTGVKATRIVKVKGNQALSNEDLLAVEEPLEIRLGFGPSEAREQRSLSITMRTPSHDFELAVGFLFTEGIISSTDDYFLIKHCTDAQGIPSPNIVRVELQPQLELDWSKFARHFYTNSSCGICGKASIESLESMCNTAIQSTMQMSAEAIHGMNEQMRQAQGIFEYTGSLHAAALFNSEGDLIYIREDIGRHNALDKVIGGALIQGMVPLGGHALMLSGRTCFELVQKSLMAGIPIVAAVGAPSSLAAETAIQFGITLVGFAKNNTFNIYSSPEKIGYETANTQ